MRCRCYHRLESETACHRSAAVEVCKPRKFRLRSGIRVWIGHSRKSKCRCSNIRDIGREAAENPCQPQRPSLQVAIAKMPVDPAQTQQRELMTWRQRRQILLVSIYV